MPLMTCNVTSLPVPPQAGARCPWQLPAKAANTRVLPAPPVPRIKGNLFSFCWRKMHSGTHAFTLLLVVVLRCLKSAQNQMLLRTAKDGRLALKGFERRKVRLGEQGAKCWKRQIGSNSGSSVMSSQEQRLSIGSKYTPGYADGGDQYLFTEVRNWTSTLFWLMFYYLHVYFFSTH